MITVVAFVVAAAAGTLLRASAGSWPTIRGVPSGTLAVNVTASFALALIASWSPPTATVVGTAGLGALSTFSTFAAEVVSSDRRTGVRIAVAHLLTCPLAAFVGLQL